MPYDGWTRTQFDFFLTRAIRAKTRARADEIETMMAAIAGSLDKKANKSAIQSIDRMRKI